MELIVKNETKNESCLSNGGIGLSYGSCGLGTASGSRENIGKNGMLHRETSRCENLREPGLELD